MTAKIIPFPLRLVPNESQERSMYLRVCARARAKLRPRRLERMRVREIFALLVEIGWNPEITPEERK